MARSANPKHDNNLRSSVTRRQLLPLFGGTAALAILAPPAAAVEVFSGRSTAKARFVYVGTYTFPGTAPSGTHQSQARGIYVFRMHPSTGGLTLLQIAEIPNLRISHSIPHCSTCTPSTR